VLVLAFEGLRGYQWTGESDRAEVKPLLPFRLPQSFRKFWSCVLDQRNSPGQASVTVAGGGLDPGGLSLVRLQHHQSRWGWRICDQRLPPTEVQQGSQERANPTLRL
jgi:hypothetical protein